MILWNIEDINSAFNMLHVLYYAQNWSILIFPLWQMMRMELI